jgi:iron(III) transport system ATP-binding protein
MVLLGPSGCGKTTLLRCVAGLERPDAGEILINGRVVFSKERNIFVPPNKRDISMIFQSYALWPHMTVFDNVAYPLRSSKRARKEVRTRVMDILELMGLAHVEHRHPGRISGGQQQRVALARALVARPDVVLFDEPLSNVDALVRKRLRIELVRMQKDFGFCGMYVTHDQEEAMEVGQRITVLNHGTVAAVDTPAGIYRNPPSREIAQFIGSANVCHVTVDGARGSAVLVTEDSLGTVEVANADAALATRGARKQIIVRPEHVLLDPSPAPDPDERNCWNGTVETRMFAGATTTYIVRCRDVRFEVSSSDDDYVEGQDVTVRIPPRRVLLVDQDAA